MILVKGVIFCVFATFVSVALFSSVALSFLPIPGLSITRVISYQSIIVRKSLDVDVSGLLDIEQSKAIASRALEEEELLRDNQDILEFIDERERNKAKKAIKKMQNKLRVSSGGGGFGSSSKAKKGDSNGSSSYNPKFDKDGFGAILIRDGVARVNNAMKESTASELKHYVDILLQSAIQDEEAASSSGNFARVLLPKNRWDLLLPFDSSSYAVMAAMEELLGENGSLNSILDSTVGKDGRLYELAALVSDKGSERQVIHPDIPFESEDSVTLVTCFVALQDIDDTMGPTVYLPGTNSAYHHEKLNGNRSDADEMLRNTQNNIATLDIGDCSVYNPASLHCGSANKSDRRRSIFYMTFWNPNKQYPGTSNNPGSLRTDIREKSLSLKSLRKEIGDWKKMNKE